MKKISLLFSLLFLFALGKAYAQESNQERGQRQRVEPEQMAERTANLWQENFGLSDEQHKKIYELLLKNQKDTQAKMEELRANSDREGLRTLMAEQYELVEKGAKEIFTAQQWTAFEQWKKDNPPNQRRRRGGGE